MRTPARPTSGLFGAVTPRPRFPGKQKGRCPMVFPENPAVRLQSVCTTSTRHGVRNNFQNSLFGDARTPHETELSLARRRDPRPRVPGKQKVRCPRVISEDPALRLLSGSTPSTRHGVRNNFKNSLFWGGGGADPTRRTLACSAQRPPRPRFPGKQTSSCPRVFAEDPALRLLSGSIPSTRHGVRNTCN
jgi:hypothetical protein